MVKGPGEPPYANPHDVASIAHIAHMIAVSMGVHFPEPSRSLHEKRQLE